MIYGYYYPLLLIYQYRYGDHCNHYEVLLIRFVKNDHDELCQLGMAGITRHSDKNVEYIKKGFSKGSGWKHGKILQERVYIYPDLP